MTDRLHHSSSQISQIKLTLRHDLVITLKDFGGTPVYVIEDPVQSRFYRVGIAEHTFMRSLDGNRSFAEAIARTASEMKADALTESEAAALCRWLVESGLAHTSAASEPSRLFEASEKTRTRILRSRLNPIFVKIPLFCPDKILTIATRWFGWFFATPIVLLWIVALCVAATCLCLRADQLTEMASHVVSNQNWIWLLLTGATLKIVHELAHGIACKLNGAYVREAGVLFVLLIPLPYVDVTSAWRIDSRIRRMAIAAAGMYVELTIASLAAILWYVTDSPLLRQHAFNTMLMASVVSIVFNANPLMRFDGYYLLSDWLELPNLATHGQKCLHQLGKQVVFGIKRESPDWPEGRTTVVFGYGLLAFLWRLVIYVSLILIADRMFFGAGIVLAFIAMVMWVILPILKLLKFLTWGSETESPNRLRFTFFTVVAGTLCYAIAQIPWYSKTSIPAIVDYEQISDVRVRVSGFVEDVPIRAGQKVKKGQTLLQLSNPELQLRREQTKGELRRTAQKARLLNRRGEIAQWRSELQLLDSLNRTLQHQDEQLNDLTIVATEDGFVLNPLIESQIGTYLQPGDLVTQLGSGKEKTLIAMIPEVDYQRFSERTEEPFQCQIDGRLGATSEVTLKSIEPQASTNIRHPALASTGGGVLDVAIPATSPQKHASSNSHANPNEQQRFLNPHFLAKANLADRSYLPGQTGSLFFRAQKGSVGSVLSKAFQSWLLRRQAALSRSLTEGH